ncbi:hypothetical protein ABB02_01761 [Clostridiaceae bacterium JG1575]|nr:hypothetical protein ABB02_01761 [Clostridiaceae bacterium JG1575]
MHPKNFPWILLGALLVVLGVFFEDLFWIQTHEFQGIIRVAAIVYAGFPLVFFLTAFLTNRRGPADFFQLIVLLAVFFIAIRVRAGELVLDKDALFFLAYLGANLLGMLLGRLRARRAPMRDQG